jgi:hypothetical protein
MNMRRSPHRLPGGIRSGASGGLKALSRGVRTAAEVLSEIPPMLDFARTVYLDFEIRPSDVFIVTYPRSGTTFMQMILHQLATGGDMNFEHIDEVVPWFERSVSRTGRDLSKIPSPRIFKSHLSYRWIPKGPCRYIYVSRNGKDAAVSYFHFYTSHLGFSGDFEDFFVRRFVTGKVQFGSWFQHVTDWRQNKKGLNVLYVNYESLVSDLPGSARQIADFCGFSISEDGFSEILENCRFDTMKRHEDKFDHIHSLIREMGLKRQSFLRKGTSGDAESVFTPKLETLFKRELYKHGMSAQ